MKADGGDAAGLPGAALRKPPRAVMGVKAGRGDSGSANREYCGGGAEGERD